MKAHKIPATAIKALLHLAQQPRARLLIVADCYYLLDGNSKEHKHLHIPAAAFDVLREKEWITVPQERGSHLAECALAQEGKAVAEKIIALQSGFHQLEFDEEISNPAIKTQIAQELPGQEAPAEAGSHSAQTDAPQTEEQEAIQGNNQMQVNNDPTSKPQARPEEAISQKASQKEIRHQPRKTKEEAKAERIEKRAAIQKDMQQAVSNLLESIKVGKSERLLQYLAFSSRFHNYSPLNQLMISLQAPQATRVAGYTAWKKAGYQVKKGEKGIAILAPRPFHKITKINEETGEEEMIGYQGITFRLAYVFDVSQLEENPEKPLPTFFTSLTGDH